MIAAGTQINPSTYKIRRASADLSIGYDCYVSIGMISHLKYMTKSNFIAWLEKRSAGEALQ